MFPTTLLADTWSDVFPFLIMIGIFVMVPIIAMMTKHQRKMAEILHGRVEGQKTDDLILERLDAMQRELTDLRQRQNDTILALEDRKSPEVVQERIRE